MGVSAGSEGRVSQEWDQGSMGELEGISQWSACFYTWTSAAVALKQVPVSIATGQWQGSSYIELGG